MVMLCPPYIVLSCMYECIFSNENIMWRKVLQPSCNTHLSLSNNTSDYPVVWRAVRGVISVFCIFSVLKWKFMSSVVLNALSE